MRGLLLTLVLAAGCGKGSEPPEATSGSPNAMPETGPKKPGSKINEQAIARFESLCATCHGANGKGDGPAAANLSVKPRDYTDPAWQASVTDDQLRQIILLG